MAVRLPVPHDDIGNWGEILNEFLTMSHDKDGGLKENVVGLKQLQDQSVTTAKLDASVQTTLSKADSAVQPEQLAVLTTNTTAASANGISVPYYALKTTVVQHRLMPQLMTPRSRRQFRTL